MVVTGYLIELYVWIDARSVFSAVENENFKYPTEKSLLSHISWIKQLTTSKIINILGWVDTRDMIADGMTKGSIDRSQLISAMKGFVRRLHPAEFMKTRGTRQDQRDTSSGKHRYRSLSSSQLQHLTNLQENTRLERYMIYHTSGTLLSM